MNLQWDTQSEMAGSLAGFRLYAGHFDRTGQVELLAAVRAVLQTAPLFTPRMPKSGRPFSVRMSNCGPLSWVSDEGGYRYRPSHPKTSRPWPPGRNDPTGSIRIGLSSGEVLVLGGASRLAFHGVDRIYPGTSSLLPEGGRINLTLRRVKRSGPDLRTDEIPSA
jgi:alkylated DNA repair dioxygenase AlkB